MGFYRRLPLTVEARQVTADSGAELARWCGGTWRPGGPLAPALLLVPTLEGDLAAWDGDWVVRGTRGEFWPVKAGIFEATYESAAGGEQGA